MTWHDRLSFWAFGYQCWCSRATWPEGEPTPNPWTFVRVPLVGGKPLRQITVAGRSFDVPWYYEWDGEERYRVSAAGYHPRADRIVCPTEGVSSTERAPCKVIKGRWVCAGCGYDLQATPEENLAAITPAQWAEASPIVGAIFHREGGPHPAPWGAAPVRLDSCNLDNHLLGGAAMLPVAQSVRKAPCSRKRIRAIAGEDWLCRWSDDGPISRVTDATAIEEAVR
jgi:hypothetical protein